MAVLRQVETQAERYLLYDSLYKIFMLNKIQYSTYLNRADNILKYHNSPFGAHQGSLRTFQE